MRLLRQRPPRPARQTTAIVASSLKHPTGRPFGPRPTGGRMGATGVPPCLRFPWPQRLTAPQARRDGAGPAARLLTARAKSEARLAAITHEAPATDRAYVWPSPSVRVFGSDGRPLVTTWEAAAYDAFHNQRESYLGPRWSPERRLTQPRTVQAARRGGTERGGSGRGENWVWIRVLVWPKVTTEPRRHAARQHAPQAARNVVVL
ncbi:hypothetical protein E2C01_077337 [Portunus trituberculatus]|uniref:Uncharacterized protein n=1 Tax=Portunus trituberculatus TaxID=210409 RepID=A0A5B7IB80_PORTR|nr:hypothetical protein [Portunus trituberculatus]